MKRIVLSLIAMLVLHSAFSQIQVGVRQKLNTKGYINKEGQYDSILVPPRVRPSNPGLTNVGAISVDVPNKRIWFVNASGVWDTIAGGGGGSFIANLDSVLRVRRSLYPVDSVTLQLENDTLVEHVMGGLKHAYAVDPVSGFRGYIPLKEYNTFKSYAQFRGANFLDTSVIYRTVINGNVRDWEYDPTDLTSPDDSAMVLVHGTQRWKKAYDIVNVADFGAIPNIATDQSYIFQKAINFAIYNSKSAHLYIPGGYYYVKNLVVMRNHSGSTQYVSLSISGASNAYDHVGGEITELRNTDGNSFTINFQLALSCEIKNIHFVGAAPAPGSVKQLIEWNASDWTAGGTIRNHTNGPHLLIGVDLFHWSLTGAARYPGVPAWYYDQAGVSGLGGTSGLVIQGCSFRNAIAGVANSISGVLGNGDNVVMRDCFAMNIKNLWVGGSIQTRGGSITNLYTAGNIECIINGAEYGTQIGTPPNIMNSSINQQKYIYRLQGEFSGFFMSGSYLEEVYSMGKAAVPQPITVFGGHLSMMQGLGGLKFVSPTFAEGNIINFVGTSLEWLDNEYRTGWAFNSNMVKFSGTTLRGNAPFTSKGTAGAGNIKFDNIQFDGVHYQNFEATTGYEYLTQGLSQTVWSPANPNGRHIVEGMKYRVAPQDRDHVYEALGPTIENIPMGTATLLSIDSIAGTAYFLSTDSELFAGQLTTAEQVDWPNDIYEPARTILGVVQTTSGDTVFLKRIPYGVQTGVAYTVYQTRVPKFWARTIGSVTENNDTVKNVINDGGITFAVGALIKGNGIRHGTRINEIIGAYPNQSFKLSAPAYATVANTPLYDAIVRVTGRNNYPYSTLTEPYTLFPRDIIIPGYGSLPFEAAPTWQWWVKTAGKFGTAVPPTIAAVFDQTDSIAAHRAAFTTLYNGTNNFLGINNQFKYQLNVGIANEIGGTFIQLAPNAMYDSWNNIQSIKYAGGAYGDIAMNREAGNIFVGMNPITTTDRLTVKDASGVYSTTTHSLFRIKTTPATALSYIEFETAGSAGGRIAAAGPSYPTAGMYTPNSFSINSYGADGLHLITNDAGGAIRFIVGGNDVSKFRGGIDPTSGRLEWRFNAGYNSAKTLTALDWTYKQQQDSLHSALLDSLERHLDTLQAHNIRINAISGGEGNNGVFATRTVAGDATVTSADHTLRMDAIEGAVIVNLPAAATVSGQVFNIKKIDATSNTVTIDPNGSETIDGTATKVISTQFTSLKIQSNGTGWDIL